MATDYLDFFPEEWKRYLTKSIESMKNDDCETAFLYLAVVIEKFAEEVGGRKLKGFKEQAKERLKRDVKLESERKMISQNVEKMLRFAEKYVEKLEIPFEIYKRNQEHCSPQVKFL